MFMTYVIYNKNTVNYTNTVNSKNTVYLNR